MVRRTADKVFIPFTVGGGIRSEDDVRRLLESGADKTSLNTAAVADPQLVERCAKRFGSQCIVVAIDAKGDRRGRWEVYTHGGRTPTGIDAVEWAKKVVDLGAGEILLTSMDTDGHLDGYDIPLTRAISDAVEVPVIASGGCGDAPAHGRRHRRWQGRRRPRRQHLPLRHLHHPPDQGVPGGARYPRAALMRSAPMTDAPGDMLLENDRRRAAPSAGAQPARLATLSLPSRAVCGPGSSAGRSSTIPGGFVQGGILSAMLDGVMGAAAVSLLGAGELITTLEMKTSYMQSVRDVKLIAEGWVRQRGGSVVFMDGTLTARRRVAGCHRDSDGPGRAPAVISAGGGRLSMLNFDKGNGLIPVVIQDDDTDEVLTLGLHEPGVAVAHYRVAVRCGSTVVAVSELWHKGATSGNFLNVRRILVDCDDDALLVRVQPLGPACHTGERSCFHRELDNLPEE